MTVLEIALAITDPVITILAATLIVRGDTGLLNNTNDAIDRLYGFCTDDCDRGDVGSPQAFDIGNELIQRLNDQLHQVRRGLFALQLACTGE